MLLHGAFPSPQGSNGVFVLVPYCDSHGESQGLHAACCHSPCTCPVTFVWADALDLEDHQLTLVPFCLFAAMSGHISSTAAPDPTGYKATSQFSSLGVEAAPSVQGGRQKWALAVCRSRFSRASAARWSYWTWGTRLLIHTDESLWPCLYGDRTGQLQLWGISVQL